MARTKSSLLLAATLIAVAYPGRARGETVLVLAKSNIAGTSEATFGAGSTAGGAALRPILDALDAAGARRVAAGDVTIATTPGSATSLLPVGDSAAAQAAAARGAQLAIVYGVASRGDGPIRGTALQGAVASFQLRAIDASGSVRFELKGTGSAYAADAASAAGAAAVDASAAAARQVSRRMRGTAAVAAGGEVPIIISGAQTLEPMMAIVGRLASTRGVSSIRVLRLGVDRATVAARGATPSQIASSLAQVRLDGAAIRPRAGADEVQVTVSQGSSQAP